ncbi:hypothetical protein HMPREF0765_1630 [Sphingobacterium spiritivorum ATCC 33300]|uniref:YdhG-like domain-containing protein n=1 Tax=Sphingobacterium spiritivorum ATCC 33300 TaxID=525372 RepID=C2FWC4_SPHSI|nr:DUF1801 domain-containing protein [Sphingobacterium spiritivorum]EEI92779.1 hypothetical protein HMPREF0765_1630 [Sphingobacterium spiritivorum ATCC 33300]QQS96443.1 DUF1801 domain-containing protein [Sphingobacterium spiritivorum]
MISAEEYIASFPKEISERLTIIRKLIKDCSEELAEGMAYKMPSYKYKGKPLVYFAGYPQHIGFYATPNGNIAFEKELASYKQGKGSVQFPHDRPLPLDLIKRIVLFRMEENAGKAK